MKVQKNFKLYKQFNSQFNQLDQELHSKIFHRLDYQLLGQLNKESRAELRRQLYNQLRRYSSQLYMERFYIYNRRLYEQFQNQLHRLNK